MTDLATLSARLTELLHLDTVPVALTFSVTPPTGVERVDDAAPAGCAYWSRAAGGDVFYTTSTDHHGCAVGAYTHGAEMGPAQQAELQQLIGVMSGLSYLAADEVPSIPARHEPLAVLTYAPLSRAPEAPSVVLVRVRARQAMLLAEALHASQLREGAAPVMRPACAMVPQVLDTARAATSFGCIGNRTYTGLGDDELWYALPGAGLGKLCDALETIGRANDELAKFHQGRLRLRLS